jgi:hypothetical protein
MAYHPVPFPKFMYHPREPARVVHGQDEVEALGDEWFDSPAKAAEAARGAASTAQQPALTETPVDVPAASAAEDLEEKLDTGKKKPTGKK